MGQQRSGGVQEASLGTTEIGGGDPAGASSPSRSFPGGLIKNFNLQMGALLDRGAY